MITARYDVILDQSERAHLYDHLTNYTTVEPRFNEVAGDRPNLFVKWRVRYIEVLLHTFYCNFGQDIEIISFVISRTSLNRGSLNRGSTVKCIILQVLADAMSDLNKAGYPYHKVSSRTFPSKLDLEDK